MSQLPEIQMLSNKPNLSWCSLQPGGTGCPGGLPRPPGAWTSVTCVAARHAGP